MDAVEAVAGVAGLPAMPATAATGAPLAAAAAAASLAAATGAGPGSPLSPRTSAAALQLLTAPRHRLSQSSSFHTGGALEGGAEAAHQALAMEREASEVGPRA